MGGNIAIRVGRRTSLSARRRSFSKGFMKPEDMCLVDLEGNQTRGLEKNAPSEILMHLQIMKRQPPGAGSRRCNCHPPYSTGFAGAGVVQRPYVP